MLRAKADLQQVVVSAEFVRRKKSLDKKGRLRAHEEIDLDGGDDSTSQAVESAADQVKSILMDEAGFWKPLVTVLRVTYPVVTLLRLMDSNKPCLGKVYHRMCDVITRMEGLQNSCDWIEDALEIHRDRWEYLHSPFHAAAYALDPEFFDVVGHIDADCQKGVTQVMERLAILDVIAEKKCDISTADKLAAVVEKYDKKHPEVIARVAQGEHEFLLYKKHKPPLNRDAVKINALKMEPYDWWDMYCGHLPILQGVARRVLAQVASAFAAERNWSVYGDVKHDKMSRLEHSTADARVYAHEALQLHEKMNKAVDAEWASSDSDSNASDVGSDDEELEKLMR